MAMTFEEVDKIVSKSVGLGQSESAGGVATLVAPMSVQPVAAMSVEWCDAYQAVRPILELLLATPLIPGSWRIAIRTFMVALDAACR